MNPGIRCVALVLLGLAVGGFLVAASGIIPVKASSGHWAITRWLLEFGMERSISTHSFGVEVPRLDDPALILKGAGHYEIGCRSCHGAPGALLPRIAQAMTPAPPELGPRVKESTPKKLFQVVKHGLKFTGMPAWPSQHRDDEVWAMVAFLLELPKLDAASYENLVKGNATVSNPAETINLTPPVPEIPSSTAQMCARCHGREGEGRGDGAFPRLAGQRRDYLLNTLSAYARGARHSGIMEPVAAGLTEELIHNLSAHYATLPARSRESAAPARSELWERGRRIAEEGLPKKRVPSCIECHGPKGTRTKPAYPSLTGLSADYLLLQLELFKNEQRGGTAYAHLMQEVVAGLEPEDMRAVAQYFESLPPDFEP